MLKSRFPISFLKGTLGLCLAVLLLAPAATLWSAAKLTLPEPEKSRGPAQKYAPGQTYPVEWIEQELAWKRKNTRPLYERKGDFWKPENGPRRIGVVDIAQAKSPHVLHLPVGSWDTAKGRPTIAESMKARPHGPNDTQGSFLLVQFREDAVRGKTTREVRQLLKGMGVNSIDASVPNLGYIVEVAGKNRQKVMSDPKLQFADDYHPRYKIHPGIGQTKLLSPSRAASDDYDVVVRTFKGKGPDDVVSAIGDLGGTVTAVQEFSGRAIIRATVNKDAIYDLAKHPDVKLISEKPDRIDMTLVTSLQTEVGRLLDPRIEGKFVRPFTEEGIDGGGEYSTVAGTPVGCTPWSDGDEVDPGCYNIPPQFVGLADNGIDLDSAPLAHSSTDPCSDPDRSCASLATGDGVGAGHRKVELYVNSKDHNHDLTNEDGTGEGDFLSCSSILSGGASHGMLVAGTMLGNPSEGQFGLGFFFDDNDNSNQFFSYFNDEHEVNLPMDGQARGARLLFIDGRGNGSNVIGPPPCATNLLSDVDFGAAVVDEVETMIYRRDLNLAHASTEPSVNADSLRGAKVVVLPFGAPTDFDNNVFNGHGTYAGDAEDIDDLLFNNRRVLVVVPVGNDGANPNSGAKRDPFAPDPNDPNDGADPNNPLLDPQDLQVGDLATGKNIVSVGSNNTDTLQIPISAIDNTSFVNAFSSKGPRTLATPGSIAPLVIAPGTEPAKGGGGREGEYSDDYFSSHAVIMSFDDEQDTAEGIETVRNQRKVGTSLSSGKVGGAAAQIRDYFAKGYYPLGLRGTGAGLTDISGALVKAVLVGSSNFKNSSLIPNCTHAFCVEEGYGAVELANVLPLKSYGVARRPNNTTNLPNGPDVPSNILVADEYFDGGLGFGVVEVGKEVQYEFYLVHGGASLRAALAWYDAPGEALVNNLDLEVLDGDQDDVIGWDVAFGTAGPGSGMCNSTAFGGAGVFASACGFCTIAALQSSAGNSIADPPYFDPNPSADPNASNPYLRRFLGNQLTDRQRFSQWADCDSGTGALDGASPNSQYDTDNTTEFVHLYSANGFGVLGASIGSGSEGPHKVVVSYPDTGSQVGVPNTPCVVPAAGSSSLDTSTPGGNDVVLTTRDGLEYIASGVDNPGTPGVDEAQCDSTATGTDRQLVSSGAIGQPFGLVVTGPIAYAGNSRSQISLNQTSYDCSDSSLRVEVTEEDQVFGANISAQIAAGTTIQVLNPSGTPVDEEGGLSFARTFAASVFRSYRDMDYTSSAKRVQYIGNLGRAPIFNNGIVEVDDGDTIRATYTDPGDSSDTVETRSSVICTPKITPAFVGLTNENFHQKFIGGGCDIGRAITLRGDFNLDAKENVQYSVYGTNHAGFELKDLRATLTCQNPAGTSENPCQYLGLQDPVQRLGRVPFGRQFGATWNIKVDENVRNLTTSSEKVVELVVTFDASNSDTGNTLASQSFTFREALEADNERLFYFTDAPTGGKRAIDYNQNGNIEAAELANGGRREEREVRTYQDWTGTSNAGLLASCSGSCIPFDFDTNNGGFTTHLAPDSKPGSGYPTSTQGWAYGTGGACGWQTQATSGGASAAKGVWHLGQRPIGTFGSGCGQYVVPSDPATGPTVEFVNHLLTSPVFHKVNTGTDARGFDFEVRMESLAWNANEELADNQATLQVEIDTDIDGDIDVILGDSYTYRAVFTIAKTLTNSVQGARRFGPLFDPDNSIGLGTGPTGDEVGVSAPLPKYDAGSFLQRNLMPTPARDSDNNSANGFTSDTRISDGVNCPPVPVGSPCLSSGFTTRSGPVRNRDIDTGGSYEDFRGTAGDNFQFEFSLTIGEAGSQATGYTIDNVAFEWSEQHPADNPTYSGGVCSTDPGTPIGATCVSNTCNGGPRNGLFCSTATDCRDVIIEGTCTASVCTAGRVGVSCTVNNDCDLGRCTAGNTELGCSVNANCNLATNDCDAVPFRVSPTSGGNTGIATQCATISFEKLFLYDCTSSVGVTVQDGTPDVCGPMTDVDNDGVNDGCSTSPRQILVNARSGQEPLGESFKLSETSLNSGVFKGDVPLSAVNNQPGTLYFDSDPGERVNLVVSYDDPDCDADVDGVTGESNFKDFDGDGVPNFGADGVSGDQDAVLTYISGGKISDDDNCAVYNPAGVAQMDLNGDGLINGSDCVVDPLHNKSGQCDWDSDGVGDICDNCPKTANNNQLDTDSDGIGSVCENNDIDKDTVINEADNCPTIYNPSQGQTGGGGGGGSRFNRGTLCDSGTDIDLDGVIERLDNCPNEQLVENGLGGFAPGPCAGGGLTCTYNPEQRDTDADGIGDVCDDEDFDKDGVINNLDNCVTIYNPADPTFQSQTDSDGDGLGDDRAGRDTVGRCVGGPTPGKLCLPINTGANCGVGGFCVQSSDAYCDFDSTDDNFNGVPDDLVQFTTEIDCNYSPGGLGNPAAEVAKVGISAVSISDDGTADHVCVSGDPNPNNNPALIEDCPIADPGPAGDASCDTPGGGGGDGDCEPVSDGIVDPGELTSVQIVMANQTVNAANVGRALTNAIVGITTGSPTVGCITKGQVFVGTMPAGALTTTPAGGLQFILSPTTGQSVAAKFAEAEFTMNILADGIEANSPDATFKIIGDADSVVFPLIASACGTPTSGSALDPNHGAPGVLCEDFDTDRNTNGSFQFTRLFPAASADPLAGVPDFTDDVLGHTQDGGPVPFGVNGQICSSDAAFPGALSTCHPVPSENDWHVHSQFEGCGASYSTIGGLATRCDGGEARAHSGFRSMHLGRHLNATNTLFDTYRLRQTSAFTMDPINFGVNSTLEFWHTISTCDDRCINGGPGTTTAGGIVQVSLLDNNTGLYEPWQKLTPNTNGYNSVDQERIVICEFDPGDDQGGPLNETMCGGLSQWSDIGDIYGVDLTCTTDTDGNDPVNNDCGETTSRTHTACSWVADPACGNFLENGSVGRGVWARSTFGLAPFSGRQARLRWVFQGGGGWSFGESRSFLEPESGNPFFGYDQDDGWYVDDIKLTDLRTGPANTVPDPDDGTSVCPSQGDTDNCGAISVVVAGAAVDATAGDLVLFGNVSSGAVLLDARQSTAGDDPGTIGLTEAACASGVLEYQWSQLDDIGGSVVSVLQTYSPDATVFVSPAGDATYRVEVRCSSDTACAATQDVSLLAYTGDGNDLATQTHNHSPIGILDGLFIEHNPSTNEATLSWRSRPQPQGVSGYNIWKATVSGANTDLFPGDVWIGGGAGMAFCGIANGATGTRRTQVDSAMPAVGSANLYMLGHRSLNATQAPSPLGNRPASSNKAGTLVFSKATCP